MKSAVIILAGGNGTRYSSNLNKSLETINDIPLWKIVLETYIKAGVAQKFVLVCNPKIIKSVSDELQHEVAFQNGLIDVILGGAERQNSIMNGMKSLLKNKIDVIYVHEAARPVIDYQTLLTCDSEIVDNEAVLPVQKSRDGLLEINPEKQVVGFRDRRTTVCGIGPEVFRYKSGFDAFQEAEKDNLIFPESCSLLNYYNVKVKTIFVDIPTIKVTHPEDLYIAECLINYGGKT